MKMFALLALMALTLNVYSADYPTGPDARITPGALCDHPDSYRYPEHIAYCERDVSSHTKAEIFETYRTKLGYKLDLSHRSDYKIDHFIPLCAGGSNEKTNLWPQHVSVFTITDPLEGLGCEKLSQGVITQKDLIELIKSAKLNLSTVPQVLQHLQSL